MRNKWGMASLLFCLSLSSGLAAFESALNFDASLAGVTGWNPARRAEDNLRSQGAEASLGLSPVFGWRGSPWFMTPSYGADYSSVNNVLKVDEEIFIFAQRLNQDLNLGGHYRFAGGSKLKLAAVASVFNGIESKDESLGKGQYDYLDSGLDTSWDSSRPKDGSGFRYSMGLRAYRRQYPNYASLDVSARKEKDSNVGKFYADGDWAWTASGRATGYLYLSFQSLAFPQAVVIDETGTTLAGTLRSDRVINFQFDNPVDFGANKISFGYSLETRDSNVAYYDSQAGVFFDNFDDYSEHGLSLSYSHSFAGPWGWFEAPELTFDLSTSFRLYATRLAKNEKGEYLLGKEYSNQFNSELGLNSPVAQRWSVFTKLSYYRAGSNNLDQSLSLNNYQFMNFKLGGQYSY